MEYLSVLKVYVAKYAKDQLMCMRMQRKEKYHIHCYKENRNPNCYFCTGKPQGMNYVIFEDDQRMCLECMESSVMDSLESQHFQREIRGFFDGLYMKNNEKEFSIHLVKKQAPSRAVTEKKIDYHSRGLCLSKELSVPSIIKGPIIGLDKKLTDVVTERKWVNGCILIIYGLPRLLTGYILAHEMMHAWLRLNGYRDLKEELEEGLCQMLALSEFEKKHIKFCIYQIKEDDSVVYGKGFQQVNDMMLQNNNYSIKNTVQEIVRASEAIPDAKLYISHIYIIPLY